MNQPTRILKSEALLALAAIIWGFAFVAQREGMTHVGPFTFNAVRFLLGALSLIPVVVIRERVAPRTANARGGSGKFVLIGVSAGLILFVASSLQQIGVMYTTAGKAGFITGLYVILVPMLGLVLGHRAGRWTWLGAITAVVGLYLLSVTEMLTIATGDGLVLISAFFWASHVLLIGRFSAHVGALRLALVQFVVCSTLSFAAALMVETIRFEDISGGAISILYTGLLSVGVAYTLQAVGQKDTPPAQAAIILSLEAVFAVIGGWLVLGEALPLRGLVGCGLMLIGMIVSQMGNGEQTVVTERA